MEYHQIELCDDEFSYMLHLTFTLYFSYGLDSNKNLFCYFIIMSISLCLNIFKAYLSLEFKHSVDKIALYLLSSSCGMRLRCFYCCSGAFKPVAELLGLFIALGPVLWFTFANIRYAAKRLLCPDRSCTKVAPFFLLFTLWPRFHSCLLWVSCMRPVLGLSWFIRVTSLAALSASAFTGTPQWLGTHWRITLQSALFSNSLILLVPGVLFSIAWSRDWL